MAYGYTSGNPTMLQALADQTQSNPMSQFIAPPPTQPAQVVPQEKDDAATQQALIDALRGMSSRAAPAAAAGPIQSAGYLGQGMDTKAIGGALGSLFSK